MTRARAGAHGRAAARLRAARDARRDAPRWPRFLLAPRCRRAHVVVLSSCSSSIPFVATPFFTFQIAAQSFALGMIALSLAFLGGYGGMISLAQMTVAGIAGYLVAIFGTSGTAEISLDWPWWVVVPLAIAIATLCGTLIGWLSVRTEGIYTIMITLAIGVAFHYLVLQNYSVFNGFQGLQRVYPPQVLGDRLALAGAVLLPVPVLRAGRVSRGQVRDPRAVRHRAAGHPRQPAPHERARLLRHRASRRRLRASRA